MVPFSFKNGNGDYNAFTCPSRRDSPVRGQIYLLKIASIYGNFTPIGPKMSIYGYLLKIESVQKFIDYTLKMKKAY